MTTRVLIPWTALAALAGLALISIGGCGIVTPGLSPEQRPGTGGGGSVPFNTSLVSTSTAGSTAASGAGGAALGSATATGSSTGGSVQRTPDAGVVPLTSYQYLCGGSQATCLPGAATDLCAPGGNPGLGGGTPSASTYSCQLVALNGGDGGVGAQCNNSGTQRVGEACKTASDCAGELGCVQIDGASVCRPYCCDGLETCSDMQTYCVASPMADAPTNLIPVCVSATSCALFSSLPGVTCSGGTACAIVRESGTTSCVTPGAGQAGDACPCAAGFTCSFVDGTCVELCQTNGTGCGTTGYCQGGVAPYPTGVGYCVSY